MVHDGVPPDAADCSGPQGHRGAAGGEGIDASAGGEGTDAGASGEGTDAGAGGRDGVSPGEHYGVGPGDRTRGTGDDSGGPSGGASRAALDGFWSAEAAVRVASQERSRAHWLIRRGMVLPVGVWGVAWLLGFLAMWSGELRGGNPWFRLAEPVAEVLFGGAIVVAGVVSVVVGIVSHQGVQGPSRQREALYGWAWSVSMVAVGVAGLLLTAQAPGQRWLLVPTLFTVTAGAMAMVSGALLRSVLHFALGGVLVLLGVCGVWIGLPGMFLLYGLAGGAVLLVFAILVRLRPVREGRW